MSPSYDDYLKWAPVAAAFASAVAATAAAINVWLQNKNARRNRSIDLLLKKEAEFDSARMHKARAGAAKALLEKAKENVDVDCVLDFMESVAGLVIGGDLEEELAWSTFYHWFSHYYYATAWIIKKAQEEDRSVWCDLADLHTRMERFQGKRGSTLRNNLPQDIKHFLEAEARLLSCPSHAS